MWMQLPYCRGSAEVRMCEGSSLHWDKWYKSERFHSLSCDAIPKALFKYEWHSVYVCISNMYVHKDLQKCKYCSAHKCLPLRLPGKVALGHKLVTISAAEANNEVKYICMCMGCKTLALNHVPLRAWWYQFPSTSAPLSSVAGVTSRSLLLLPTPWMSVHFSWQRLPEQMG